LSQLSQIKTMGNSLQKAKAAWEEAQTVSRELQGKSSLARKAINATSNAQQKAIARVAANKARAKAANAVAKAANLKSKMNSVSSKLSTATGGATKMARNKLTQALKHVANGGSVNVSAQNKLVRLFQSNGRVAAALQNSAQAKTLLNSVATLVPALG
jgi:Tfp pilus assembly protein FimV